MRKGQLNEDFFKIQRLSISQSLSAGTSKEVRDTAPCPGPTKPKSTKAPSGKTKIKPKAQFGPLPLQQARVLNQLQSLYLKPLATKQAPGSENEAQGLIKLIRTEASAAAKPGTKPAHQRLHKLKHCLLAPSGDTDSEVESPLSQQPLAKHQLASPPAPCVPAAPHTQDAAQLASTPAKVQLSNVSATSSAGTPDSMAMCTPGCGQAPVSCSSNPAAPMSCSSAEHTASRAGARSSRLTAASSANSPMCISPDLWATPQQLQWKLSEDQIVPAAQQPQPPTPRPLVALTEAEMKAAEQLCGFGTLLPPSPAAPAGLGQGNSLNSPVAGTSYLSPKDQGCCVDTDNLDYLEPALLQPQLPGQPDQASVSLFPPTAGFPSSQGRSRASPLQQRTTGSSPVEQYFHKCSSPHASPRYFDKRSSTSGVDPAVCDAVSPEKRLRAPSAVKLLQQRPSPEQACQQTSDAAAAPDPYRNTLQQQPPPGSTAQQNDLQAAYQLYAAKLRAPLQQQQPFPARAQQQQPHLQLQPQHIRGAQQQDPKQQETVLQQQQQQALAAYQAALGRPPPHTSHCNAQAELQPLQHQQQQFQAQHTVQQHHALAQSVAGFSIAQIHSVYKAFQRQSDSIELADACNQRAATLAIQTAQDVCPAPQNGQLQSAHELVKVFCEEAGSDAGYFRQFVAAPYSRFWARYAPRLGQRPHCYEVVKGGSPCHIYFDTEFAVDSNPGLDGSALLDKLLTACSRVMRQDFQVDLQPDWVYELDSSHAGKFSRHLIIRIPGMAFVNNLAVGHLVSQILAEPEGMQILVHKGGQQAGVQQFTSLVDTAVYTRNRHFRLIWSCKAGKTHVLQPTSRFACSPGHKRSQRELFMETLICNVDPKARLLMADLISNASMVFKSGKPPAGLAASSHVGYVGHGQHEVKVSRKADALDVETAPPLTQIRVQEWAETATRHVEEVASFRAGGLPASVRTIAHCGFAGTVAYSLIGPGSHYCEHIGRCHQSNRVFFVVNFVTGMLAQKCHDPDCSHFRSTWTPLPQQLLTLLRG